MTDKVTVPHIRSRKGGPPIAMVTAYDYPTARVVSEAGVDVILVGDSVGNVVHGFDTTLSVDLDLMVAHTAAVTRARPRPLVVADLPWMTYHVSPEDTVRNAARLVAEGGAEAVKLEGGSRRVAMIERVVDAEIPVMGHLGLTPQSVHVMGGYRVQGRALEDARRVVEDAHALVEAGVFALVLEGVPDLLAELITKEVPVPTIGIGAGPHTDGQVLVYHDLVGYSFGHQPKFVRRYADLAAVATQAVAAYVRDVQTGSFPSDEESYHLSPEVAAALLGDHPSGGRSS
jgi:3-methyl-2-oxobutanoate hydroxymethyltransferase